VGADPTRSAGAKAGHAARRGFQERHHAIGQAKDALAIAAALLTDPSVENRAQAFVWAGIAMVQIGHADEDGSPALERAIFHLNEIKVTKAEASR
jgi:hypothetical protein